MRVWVWATKGSFMLLPDSVGDKLVACPGHNDAGMKKSVGGLVRPSKTGKRSHLTWSSALWAEARKRSKLIVLRVRFRESGH